LFFLGAQATEDPQAFIFQLKGSWPLGIGLGLLFAGMKWWEKKKQQLPTPEKRTLRIWPQDRVGEITVLALIFGLLGAKLFDILKTGAIFYNIQLIIFFLQRGLLFMEA
jgi:hypothetical protein